MRLLGYMVTKNEADRHLARALGSLVNVCSGVAVFDDQSTDDTPDVIIRFADHDPTVVRHARRADDEPSFAQHEGQFRNVAWRYMEAVLKPEEGDWILSLDADEVIMAPEGVDRRAAVIAATALGSSRNVDSVVVRIHELWSLTPPMERVDGYWGSIGGARLARWAPGRTIADKPMGCGSVPPSPSVSTDLFSIAHLGYVRAEDREAKHARYRGRSGHNAAHIASILRTPSLLPLDSPIDQWRSPSDR